MDAAETFLLECESASLPQDTDLSVSEDVLSVVWHFRENQWRIVAGL